MNWFKRLFGLSGSDEGGTEDNTRESPPNPTPEPKPERIVEHTPPSPPLASEKYGGDTVEVTVHRSRNVGSGVAAMVAEHIYNAFIDQFVNVTVRWRFTPKKPPNEKVRGENPGWWRNYSLQDEARDSNLLLVNSAPIGGTYGNRSVVGVGPLDRYGPHQWQWRGQTGAALNAALHEIGHSLGVGHDMDGDVSGAQHAGVGWNENGRWYRTPNVAGNGAVNDCGQYIPKRHYGDATYVMRYAPCFITKMAVRKS